MRWTSKPEWPPILVAAFAGALAVPFVPLINALMRRTLTFIPTSMFTLTGVVLGIAVGAVTWRLLVAGFVQVTESGIVLIRFERNQLLRWEELDIVDDSSRGSDAKARFRLVGGKDVVHSHLRFPRQDFHRMRHKLVDPVLMLPANERKQAALDVLGQNPRDDIILTILTVYAALLGLVAVILSLVL